MGGVSDTQEIVIMETLIELIPPTVIVAVIIWTNNLTNKRISDLQNHLLQLGAKI